MFSGSERNFLNRQRVAHFATAGRSGQPHVVPVCYVLLNDTFYFSIDEKPKRTPSARLKRVRNILENSKVAVVVDHYDEDWHQLGWVMLRGQAEILIDGDQRVEAQAALKNRYRQLAEMQLGTLPVIATRIEKVTSWGKLES